MLRVVPAEDFDEEDRQRIFRNLRRKLDGQLDFTLELVDAVRLSARGKAVYVDQRIARLEACPT